MALTMLLAGILAGTAQGRLADRPGDSVPERILFPIVGPAEWTDDFGAPRWQGSHEGNDILSDWKAPVVAVEAGKVEIHHGSAAAGCMLYLYGQSGTTYLYIHLNSDRKENDGKAGCKPGVSFAPGLETGERVRAGDLLGYVGSSGDAGATNHLHFELHPGGGRAVSPFRWLKRAERLLFVLPEKEQTAILASDTSEPTLTIAGVVEEVEAVEAQPEPAVEAPAESEPAAQAEPPPAQTPVLGRAGSVQLLTVRVSSVELSGDGGSWKVERDVVLTVAADAVVERDKGKRVRPAKLESAEKGERVTVTTGPVPFSLKSQLARPGTLAAAAVSLRGLPDD